MVRTRAQQRLSEEMHSQSSEQSPAPPASPVTRTPVSAKSKTRGSAKGRLPDRTKASPSTETISSRKTIDIEIPLPTSSLAKQVHEEEIQDTDAGSEDDAQFKTPLEKKRVVRLDDDEHDEFLTPLEAPAKDPFGRQQTTPGSKKKAEAVESARTEVEDGSDEESDDDAAPEAISSNVAKAQNVKATLAAAEAASKAVEAQRLKRKERDTFLSQQARSRRSTKETGSRLNVLTLPGQEGDEDDSAQPDETAEGSESSRKRKLNAPGLLPMDLLESDDEADDADAQLGASVVKSKKIKLDVDERLVEVKPKQDEKVGSTVYRIMPTSENGKLAPKATKQSWQLREKLLARHRAPEKTGGFIRKKI